MLIVALLSRAEHIGKTNSIDLHGLHVDEALKTLENILTTRELGW